MKYDSYVHHTICHGKQDANVVFDGYSQQLSTKSVGQARIAPNKISESILVDVNVPIGTLSQADLLSNVKNKGHLIKLLTNHPTPSWVDVQQATLGDPVSMVISFALGVLDAPNVVVWNDKDLLVELIVRASMDAQL